MFRFIVIKSGHDRGNVCKPRLNMDMQKCEFLSRLFCSITSHLILFFCLTVHLTSSLTWFRLLFLPPLVCTRGLTRNNRSPVRPNIMQRVWHPAKNIGGLSLTSFPSFFFFFSGRINEARRNVWTNLLAPEWSGGPWPDYRSQCQVGGLSFYTCRRRLMEPDKRHRVRENTISGLVGQGRRQPFI